MNITYKEWLNEAKNPPKKENKITKAISKSFFSKDSAATVGMGTYGAAIGATMSAITGGSLPAGMVAGALGGMGLWKFAQMGKGKRGRPVGSSKKKKDDPLENVNVSMSLSQLNAMKNQQPIQLEPIKPN